MELEDCDETEAYERQCIEESAQSSQQVEDSVDLPEVIHLSQRQLEADQRLHPVCVTYLSACNLIIGKAVLLFFDDCVQAKHTIIKLHCASF